MKEEFITFETAKLAKEKGFDESCKYHFDKDGGRFNSDWNPTKNSQWNDCMTQPTQSLLQRWLREEHNIEVLVFIEKTELNKYYLTSFSTQRWLIYETALEEGLYEALKLIKTK